MDLPSATGSSTLHGLAEAITTVPYQIGYHPTASLVAMCVRGTEPAPASTPSARGEVVLTARVDLVPPGDHALVMAALEPALNRQETDMVVLVAFEEGPGATLDGTALLVDVSELARSYDVTVLACARVRGRQWCPLDEKGRPASWLELPAAEDVRSVADHVLAGRAPAPDRRAVEALLRPKCQDLADSVARECADRLSRVRGSTDENRDTKTRAARTLAALMTGLSDDDGGVGELTAGDVVCTIEALDELGFRDAVLSSAIPWCRLSDDGVDTEEVRIVASAMPPPLQVDHAACVRMTQAAAYAPADRSAPWLSLIGYLAWQVGEGALANVVIGAARNADPTYSLARLVDLALCAAVAPPRPV